MAKRADLAKPCSEIERLRNQVRDLEHRIHEERRHEVRQNEEGSRFAHEPSSALSPQLSNASRHSGIDAVLGPGHAGLIWDGIHTSTARSAQKTWYGPASLVYFIGRLDRFLSQVLLQPSSESELQPKAASKFLDGPTSTRLDEEAGEKRHGRPVDTPRSGQSRDAILQHSAAGKGNWDMDAQHQSSVTEHLTPTQEEYFLNLFWQSYHTSFPILDHDVFQKHYDSLWESSTKDRKPSALVDMVIALCMQYGTAIVSPDSARPNARELKAKAYSNDATIAGRWHYRRCQALLASELESPTISTLQCHILTVIYLCCASFQNMADSTLALATRTAVMLGLHLEPGLSVPRKQREQQKRLWWCLCVLEAKTSMKLGRPFLVDVGDTTCGLPGDAREVAQLSGSQFAAPGEHATWLTFNLQNTKLVLATRAVYTAFYKECTQGSSNGSADRHHTAVSDEPQVLARSVHTEVLNRHIGTLHRWVEDVPLVLKTRRRNNGAAFSTDLSKLDIEQFSPLWLQRQRLLLELLYHNLLLNLHRPFISFIAESSLSPQPMSAPSSTSSKRSSPFTDGGRAGARRPSKIDGSQAHADTCARHATALTHIMHQVICSTDILSGWNEAFQWQWNAAMTLVGYCFSHHSQGSKTSQSPPYSADGTHKPSPLFGSQGIHADGKNSSTAEAARNAIDLCVEIFDIFGKSFVVAASAAEVIRDLRVTLDYVSGQRRSGGGAGAGLPSQVMVNTRQHLQSSARQQLLTPQTTEPESGQSHENDSEDQFDHEGASYGQAANRSISHGDPAITHTDMTANKDQSQCTDREMDFQNGAMGFGSGHVMGLGRENDVSNLRGAGNDFSMYLQHAQSDQHLANVFAHSALDMAFAVDSFNSLDMLQPDMNNDMFNSQWPFMNG